MNLFQQIQYLNEFPLFSFCTRLDSRLFGASAVAIFSIAFALWQLTIQRDKVKYPDAFFKDKSERDQKFLLRQARRRMQLAGLVGIFGVLMLVGIHMPYENHPLAWAIVWIAAIIFLSWGICLALVDALSIRLHYALEIQRNRDEKLALDYKMKQFHETTLVEIERAKEEDALSEAELDSENDADKK